MKDSSFKILLAEDDDPTRKFMTSMLRSMDYEVHAAVDGVEALEMLEDQAFDLVVSDIMMPRMDGFDLCRKIKENPSYSLLPVILCTALNSDSDRLQGLEAGADDFLTKPVDDAELRVRIRNFRRVVTLQNQVENAKALAEETVQERTIELRETIEELEIAEAEAAIAQLDVIHRLAAATEYKDADTGSHIQRIAEYSLQVATCLGWFDDDYAAIFSQASMMHDLGKIGIPDYILMKPGLLTPEEYEHMQNHTIIGWKLLSGSTTPLLQTAAKIARSHHEQWDGSGYPDGLAGEDIPPEARIVAVVDVFDALRARRCYKPEYPLEQCFEMIRARRGEHFDPDVVDAFMLCGNEIAQVNTGLSEPESDAA